MENKCDARKVAPVRLQALRNLPAEVVKSLTKEEMNSFLLQGRMAGILQEKLEEAPELTSNPGYRR